MIIFYRVLAWDYLPSQQRQGYGMTQMSRSMTVLTACATPDTDGQVHLWQCIGRWTGGDGCYAQLECDRRDPRSKCRNRAGCVCSCNDQSQREEGLLSDVTVTSDF